LKSIIKEDKRQATNTALKTPTGLAQSKAKPQQAWFDGCS
jgi:hypothetical protein